MITKIILFILAASLLYTLYLRVKRNRHWREIPTLEEYLTAFPRCKTDSGSTCRICASTNIREWGLDEPQDARKLFICNHCGVFLYKHEA